MSHRWRGSAITALPTAITAERQGQIRENGQEQRDKGARYKREETPNPNNIHGSTEILANYCTSNMCRPLRVKGLLYF